jgi:hypothetical protein
MLQAANAPYLPDFSLPLHACAAVLSSASRAGWRLTAVL